MVQARGLRTHVYLDDRLLRAPFSGNLLIPYPDPFGPVPRSEMGSELDQIKTVSPSVQLV